MPARAAFKQADATRALKAAVAAGLNPSGYRIYPATGEIEVLFGRDARTANVLDGMFGE